MPGPTFIECDRIDLRPAEETDIEFLRAGVNHPAIRRYISTFRTPYSRDGYANFGAWFHPKAWGQGYATEASAHLVEHGFRDLRLHRVSAVVGADNDASKRLCDRLGFVHEGTAREAQYVDGEYADVDRYGLLVDEWDGPEAVLEPYR